MIGEIAEHKTMSLTVGGQPNCAVNTDPPHYIFPSGTRSEIHLYHGHGAECEEAVLHIFETVPAVPFIWIEMNPYRLVVEPTDVVNGGKFVVTVSEPISADPAVPAPQYQFEIIVERSNFVAGNVFESPPAGASYTDMSQADFFHIENRAYCMLEKVKICSRFS
jgi:hypothetical protein